MARRLAVTFLFVVLAAFVGIIFINYNVHYSLNVKTNYFRVVTYKNQIINNVHAIKINDKKYICNKKESLRLLNGVKIEISSYGQKKCKKCGDIEFKKLNDGEIIYNCGRDELTINSLNGSIVNNDEYFFIGNYVLGALISNENKKIMTSGKIFSEIKSPIFGDFDAPLLRTYELHLGDVVETNNDDSSDMYGWFSVNEVDGDMDVSVRGAGSKLNILRYGFKNNELKINLHPTIFEILKANSFFTMLWAVSSFVWGVSVFLNAKKESKSE